MDAEPGRGAGVPRRILMTCDTVGGVWRYALDLSRELCRRGHAVALAAMGPAPSRAQRAEAAAVDGVVLHSRACKLVWMDDPWRDLREAGAWLSDLAAAFRPDLVHANDFGHVALAWPAPVVCVAHSCVASWWRAVHGVPAPRCWDGYRAHVRAALRSADLLVAPSRAMAAALATEYDLERRVRVIPNGTQASAPPACAKRDLVFAAGRLWDEAKNLRLLAAAAPALPWPVYVAGQAQAPDGGQAMLPNVRPLGVLRPPAMQRWFARAAIYALPARYEPFGLSVLEAARAGCALVLGDIQSLREFWDDAALFVAPDDADALRDALRRLIDDDALRSRLAARARRRALFMTVERMADDYLAAYAEVVGSPRARPTAQRAAPTARLPLPRRKACRGRGSQGASTYQGTFASPWTSGEVRRMNFVLFYHSLVSDWNHGNAHFLRGIVAELVARGHRVEVREPEDGWSRRHLVADHGEAAITAFHRRFPELHSRTYRPADLDLACALRDADVVIVHEWNPPGLVARIGRARRDGGRFRLLFHDTHHRSVTAPAEMARYDLRDYDGVLAFGGAVRQRYVDHAWHDRVFTWHEAADTRVFHPLARDHVERQLVWVGNWGDGERAHELEEYLIGPARALDLRAAVHGVRWPAPAVAALRHAGVEYRGWLPNWQVPEAFARAAVTVHVPRRPYAQALPGIPTIRVFEALACGIPLVSAPWSDCEHLFEPGADYLVAHSGREMRARLRDVLNDPGLAASLSASGLARIRARHTCGHRVTQLLDIIGSLRGDAAPTNATAREAAHA